MTTPSSCTHFSDAASMSACGSCWSSCTRRARGRASGKELVVRGPRCRPRARRTHRSPRRAPSRATCGRASISPTRAPGCCSRRSASTRDLVGINMTIATTFRRDPPPGVVVERETGSGRPRLRDAAPIPHWIDELDVAVEQGTAFAARDRAPVRRSGSDVTRATAQAWIGPMATDPNAQHGGVGSAVLAAVCADLEARRHAVRRDRVGQQPSLLRQVRRDRVARVPGRPSTPVTTP